MRHLSLFNKTCLLLSLALITQSGCKSLSIDSSPPQTSIPPREQPHKGTAIPTDKPDYWEIWPYPPATKEGTSPPSVTKPAPPKVPPSAPDRTQVSTPPGPPRLDLPLVAAQLAEIGYFRGELIIPDPKELRHALTAFQRDMGYPQTGAPDPQTLEKLSQVKLSTEHKRKLETLRKTASSRIYWSQWLLARLGYDPGPIDGTLGQNTVDALRTFQRDHTLPVSGRLDEATYQALLEAEKVRAPASSEPTSATTSRRFEKAPRAIKLPPLDRSAPEFTLQDGESVYVLDKIDCKTPNEAWLLFYQGDLQIVEKEKVAVIVRNRYGMWYDNRQHGISDENWWCIPRQRFCYSPVNFKEWAGHLSPGDSSQFKKDDAIPARLGPVSLAVEVLARECGFITKS